MKKIIIDGVELKTVAINGVQIWKSGYTNQVPLSIDTSGAVYNGCGYKDGYRVRSGGAEATAVGSSCTGFISVQGGDIVRLSGYNYAIITATNAINVYDLKLTCLGQITSSYADAGYGIFASGATQQAYCWNSGIENPTGVWNWRIPPNAGIAYIRVSGFTGDDGSKMIVTINEGIEE